MIAKTATAPLERLKMLSQTSSLQSAAGSETTGLLNITRQVMRTEGVAGFWAGNGTNLIRIFPAKAVVFGCNDFYNNWITSTITSSNPKTVAFISGGLSGMTASSLTYPLDFARGRISGKGAGADGKKRYTGLMNTIRLTVAEEGFGALYRGIRATLIGAIFYEGIKFGTVGLCEDFLGNEFSFTGGDGTSKGEKILRKTIFGALGGCAAGLLTYPNDTVRRLLQIQGSKGTTSSYSGYFDCVRKVYKEVSVLNSIERRWLGVYLDRAFN